MRLLFCFLLGTFFSYAQKTSKTHFVDEQNLLKNLTPNPKPQSWTLVYNQYATDVVLKSTGSIEYLPQFQGFKLNPNGEGYYYIAYTISGKVQYITDLESLRSFLGKIDNVHEAALLAISHGYFVDPDFKDYAANYQETPAFYILELGKMTSEECPMAKTSYIIEIDKKSGTILQEKPTTMYQEIYKKDCKNNPHYDVVKKQIEDAKKKAEEQKKIQKLMTEKMRKQLEKQRRRD